MAKKEENVGEGEMNLTEIKQKKMIMDIVTVASKNRMTIPPSVRNLMELERGDAIAFLRYDDHIGMHKIREEHLFENDNKLGNKKEK